MKVINSNTILFLDTATKYTGYAVFTKGTVTPTVYMLTNYGNIRAESKDKWEMRCLEISAKVSNLINNICPGQLVLEYPTHQGGVKGQAAARSGGTLELAYLCGRISVCWEYYISKVRLNTKMWLDLPVLVRYVEWAGQINKKITCRRLEEKLNIKADPESVDNNWADAIMMGVWYIQSRYNCPVMNSEAKEGHI